MDKLLRFFAPGLVVNVITFLCVCEILLANKKNYTENIDIFITFKDELPDRDDHEVLNQVIKPDKSNYSHDMSKQFQFQYVGMKTDIEIDVKRKGHPDSNLHTFKEVTDLIEYLHETYPHIVYIEKIGEGSVRQLPIWGVKISDNPRVSENEPTVLFTGIHHAKELLGAEVCIYLLRYFCQYYQSDEKVKNWVDNTEIWIIPVLNPDGYHMVMDEENSPEFWRKNIRDNNKNGIFDPESDGVDINRNYDFNWADESSADPRSWYYRGPYPFSEKETQAIRDLTYRKRFVFHLDYHSFGEVILYPWENYPIPADIDFVVELAKGLAKQVKKNKRFENYNIRPLNGRLGQSSIWMHAKAGVQSFIVEIGDSHFPEERRIPFIVEQNAKTAFFVLDRIAKSAIKGIIRNAYSKTPIKAEIEIDKYADPLISNPVSDQFSGFYYRIVEPGFYTLKFSAPGFQTKIVRSIKVEPDKITILNVELIPLESSLPTEN